MYSAREQINRNGIQCKSLLYFISQKCTAEGDR